MDRAAVSSRGAHVRGNVSVRSTGLPDVVRYLSKMGDGWCDTGRFLCFTRQQAQRIDPARFLQPDGMDIGASRQNHNECCLYELDRMGSYSANIGNIDMVSYSASGVFHSPLAVCAVLFPTVRTAVFRDVLSPVFFDPVPAIPACLFHRL